jgi:hypothetical protein
MKNGKAYFFSVESAEDAKRELAQFIPLELKELSNNKIAA